MQHRADEELPMLGNIGVVPYDSAGVVVAFSCKFWCGHRHELGVGFWAGRRGTGLWVLGRCRAMGRGVAMCRGLGRAGVGCYLLVTVPVRGAVGRVEARNLPILGSPF